MCPVCLTTAALIASGAVSTGGLAAFALTKLIVKVDTAKGVTSTSRSNGE